MKVEQCLISRSGMRHTITGRVKLTCEVLETSENGETKRVKILEAGAGLAVNDEIVVPTAKVTES